MQEVGFFIYHLGYIVATTGVIGPHSQYSYPLPIYTGRYIKDHGANPFEREYMTGIEGFNSDDEGSEGTRFSEHYWFPLNIKGMISQTIDPHVSPTIHSWISGVRLYANHLELRYLHNGQRNTATIPLTTNNGGTVIISTDCSFAHAIDMLLREGKSLLTALTIMKLYVMMPKDSLYTCDHAAGRLQMQYRAPKVVAAPQPPVTEEKSDEPVQCIPDEPLHRKEPGKLRRVAKPNSRVQGRFIEDGDSLERETNGDDDDTGVRHPDGSGSPVSTETA